MVEKAALDWEAENLISAACAGPNDPESPGSPAGPYLSAPSVNKEAGWDAQEGRMNSKIV